MKRVAAYLALAWALVSLCAAQSPENKTFDSVTFPIFSLNAAPVPGASIAVVGQPGQATWYFWASANYQIGNVISAIGSIQNAPNTLSSGNYVSIFPTQYPGGVTSVDILATKTPLAPVGACNCAVATGLTGGGANFQSNTLSSYTVNLLNPAAYQLVIRNEVVGSGSSHLLLRNAFTGALICDLSSGCGSGGYSTIEQAGTPLTQRTILNFPSNVSCADNPGASRTDCTPTGSGGGIVGTGIQNYFVKFTASGANPAVGNANFYESPTAAATVANTSVDFVPRLEWINWADDFAWSQAPTSPSSLSAGSNTVTLAPCPAGLSSTFLVDATPVNVPNFYVDVGTTGTAETVPVSSTTCTPYASSGTITIVTANTHSAGYTVGTATAGAQEAINDCELNNTSSLSRNCEIDLPSTPNNDIFWDAPVETHGNYITIRGHSTRISQTHPQQGIILGDHNIGGDTFFFNTVDGNIRIAPAYSGTAPQINLISGVTQTGSSPCVYTVTFTANHDFTTKYPWIYIGGGLNNNTVAGVRLISAIPAANQIQFQTASCTAITGTVYAGGFAILDYEALQDNLSTDGHLVEFNLAPSTGGNNRYHYGIDITTDQNTVFEKVTTQASSNVIRSGTTEWVGSVVLGPGPSGYQNGTEGILNITDSNLYGGAGTYNIIDWQDGNDLKIENSLLQNWGQFAVRVTRRRGGFGLLNIRGTHIEEGVISNPFGAVGLGSIISTGFPTSVDFQLGFGEFSTWATIGNQALRWIYYVMPVSSTSDTLCSTQPNDQRCISGTNYGNGPLLPAGQALVDSSSGGTVTGTYPAIRGATSYNIYRISQTAATAAPVTAPYGTGNYLIASAVNPLAACTDTVCTFTDSVGLTPTSTTVPRFQANSYGAFIDYWPGTLVLGVGSDTLMTPTTGSVPYSGVPPAAGSGLVVEELPGVHDIIFTQPMELLNGNNQAWQGFAFDSDEPSAANTTIMGAAHWFPIESTTQPGSGDLGLIANTKGKLNFGTVGGFPTTPFDVVTWWDSNFIKTQNTMGYRPSNDAADCANSFDQANGMAFRCASSISFYLNSLPDNSSWLARLTPTQWLFKVPVE